MGGQVRLACDLLFPGAGGGCPPDTAFGTAEEQHLAFDAAFYLLLYATSARWHALAALHCGHSRWCDVADDLCQTAVLAPRDDLNNIT